MSTRQAGDALPREVVRGIRQRHNLSQDELARRLGLKGGKSVISGWENGHTSCEGPAAELLLLLFGEGQPPIPLMVLQQEMDIQWRRAGNNFLTSWRQVSAAPISTVSIDSATFSSLFPGTEIPHRQYHHGFPFIDQDLPQGVYGLSDRWIGVIPIEQDRPPGYLWTLGRNAAFAYREHVWEEQPTAVTKGQTHVGSVLQIALSLTHFLQRLIERLPHGSTFDMYLQMDFEGMANRGIVGYRSDRSFPDVSLDTPPRTAVESRVSGHLTAPSVRLRADPLGVGLELAAEIIGKLRPTLATPAAIEEQLRRRHFEDVRMGSMRFLGFLDEALGRQPRRGAVSLAGRFVGILEETVRGSRFTYNRDYLKSRGAVPLSPTLRLDDAPYESIGLHPFFSNLLPEGPRLDQVSKIRKLDKGDRLGLLLALGDEIVGGAVEVRPATPGQTQ